MPLETSTEPAGGICRMPLGAKLMTVYWLILSRTTDTELTRTTIELATAEKAVLDSRRSCLYNPRSREHLTPASAAPR